MQGHELARQLLALPDREVHFGFPRDLSDTRAADIISGEVEPTVGTIEDWQVPDLGVHVIFITLDSGGWDEAVDGPPDDDWIDPAYGRMYERQAERQP